MTNELVRDPSPRPDTSIRMLPVAPGLRNDVARRHVGFTDAGGQDSWVEYPNGMVTIIVNVGAAFAGNPDAFVAGLTSRPEVIDQGGPIECLDVKLTPPGARRLLGVPLEQLTGSAVSLSDVLGPVAGEVTARITDSISWDERAGLLDRTLLDTAPARHPLDPAISWAWQRISTARRPLGVRDLAREIGWSERHFIRSFRRELGLTPHKLARITRFSAVLATLQSGVEDTDDPDDAALAVRLGYADQSHLIREVRELTGRTPRDIRRAAGVRVAE